MTSATRPEYVSVTLLSAVCMPVLTFAAALALNLGQARWIAPMIPFLLSPVIAYALLKPPRGGLLFYGWIAPCLMAAACICSSLVNDTSYDGMTYHAGAVLELLKGYNPYYVRLHAPYDFWVEHYPKATWYFAAIIAHATGFYQAGKSYHLLLALTVFFYGFAFFRRRHASRLDSGLLAFAAAANPVVINQLFAYYVDGALGSLLTLLLLSTMNLLRAPAKADRLVFIMAGCLFINVKFSAVAYFGALCVIAGIFLAYKCLVRKKESFTAILVPRLLDVALALCIGLLMLGYNPYVTNTLSNGNPMYPLLGKGKVDVMSSQSPAAFNDPELSRVEKLVWSLMSRTAQISPVTGGTPEVKWPFSVTFSEISTFTSADIRIAGWGVWMSGIMLLSIFLYLCMRGWRQGETSLALFLTLGTILINPYAWWARYAPQVALAPLFLIMPAFLSSGRAGRIGGRCIVFLLLLNSTFILIPNVTALNRITLAMDAQLGSIEHRCGKGAYQVYGATEFHYSQFAERYGILINTPRWQETEPRPLNPLLPFRDVFLYKKDCNPLHSYE